MDTFSASRGCPLTGALTVILFLTISLILYVPGMLKFVLLCDIFTKHKSDLSRDERQEIIQHCRKRCEMHSPSNKAIYSNKIIFFCLCFKNCGMQYKTFHIWNEFTLFMQMKHIFVKYQNRLITKGNSEMAVRLVQVLSCSSWKALAKWNNTSRRKLPTYVFLHLRITWGLNK